MDEKLNSNNKTIDYDRFQGSMALTKFFVLGLTFNQFGLFWAFNER